MNPRGREAEPASLIVPDIASARLDRSLRYSPRRLSLVQRISRIAYAGVFAAAVHNPMITPPAFAQEGSNQKDEQVIDPNQFTDPMVAGVVEAGADIPAENPPGLDNPPSSDFMPESTGSLDPVSFNFDIGPGVPDADVRAIQRGIDLVREELRSRYGGDLMRSINSPIPVRVVATGRGNEAPWGGGFCCMAFDPSGASLFFDVLHPEWPRSPIGKISVSGLEFGQTYLNSLGCQSLPLESQLLPHWYNEGFGNYVIHQSLIHAGILNEQVVRYSNYVIAKNNGELNYQRSLFEEKLPDIFPGYVGYLALEYLVSRAPTGAMSLRTACELVAAGASTEQAFLQAFGIGKSDFYQVFPAYVQSLLMRPIYMEQVGRLPDGSIPWITQGAIYEFNFVAYGFEDLTQAQQNAALQFPLQAQACAWGSKPEAVGKWVVALCNAKPGTYPISVRMPDGRAGQLQLNHSDTLPTLTPFIP